VKSYGNLFKPGNILPSILFKKGMHGIRSLSLWICLLQMLTLPALGQRKGSIDCPGPIRYRPTRPAPEYHVEVGAGVSKPLLYRNAAGSVGEHYRFNSLIGPYVSVTGFMQLSADLEAFAGVVASQNWQGLRFNYDDHGNSITMKCYAGTFALSIPVGIRYKVADWLKLGVGPYVAYTTHNAWEETVGSGSAVAAYYKYNTPDLEHQVRAGVRLSSDLQITKILGLTWNASVDFGQSAPSYGTADLRSQANGLYEGKLEPYLLHIGAGMSYKLFSRED
jgi:hypothetical protein